MNSRTYPSASASLTAVRWSGSWLISISVPTVIAAAINNDAVTASSGSPQRRGGLGADVEEVPLVGIDLAPRAHWPP